MHFQYFFSCLYDVVHVVSAFLFNIFDGVTCSALLDLLLFHKIHCRAVSIEKGKHMTPAHSLKTTRSSYRAQYRRHKTVMPCQKSSPPPPKLFHIGIVCLPRWSIPSPQRSLGHPLFKQSFSQKFFFIKISKLALPGVMLTYERDQYRKKRKKNLMHLFICVFCIYSSWSLPCGVCEWHTNLLLEVLFESIKLESTAPHYPFFLKLSR